ncbi:hypothetical protein HID58_073709, partial [Brassica napus]
ISPAIHDPQGQEKQQQAAGVGILLQIMMLVLSFVLGGHVLAVISSIYLPEARLIVGGLANVSNTELDSAYNLTFLFKLWSHCPFSVLGTFVASIVTGVLVYLGGVMFLMYRLPFVECLMFGSLISATDPVTVLSIFQELGSDVICMPWCLENLWPYLCTGQCPGEKSLSWSEFLYGDNQLSTSFSNLRKAIYKYQTKYYLKHLNTCFVVSYDTFLLHFILINELLALMQSTSSSMQGWILQNLECCLFVLFPYFSYMLAEGLSLSGIVSILFTGIVMKHYTYSNLSTNSQRFVSAFFHLISSLAETFVFIYMGFDIAMEKHSWSHVGFIFFSILFIVIARAANVFGCGYLVNLARPAHRKIPMTHQKALWYSGLRGAMAFALALQSVHELPDGHGQTIFTATTAIVVVTVLLIGGSTGTMLEALEVVGDSRDTSLGFEVVNNRYMTRFDDEGSPSESGFRTKLREFHKSAKSFSELDRNYLTPFFTSNNGDYDEDDDINNDQHHDLKRRRTNSFY